MSIQYLMIENKGVAPKQAFTLMGASTKRGTDKIGQFGSGNKHGISVLIRNNVYPIIYCGKLRLTFNKQQESMSGQCLDRICVKYNGFDDVENRNINREEKLGFVLGYGEMDWENNISLALREFVSNAIDESADKKDIEICIVPENSVRAKSGTTRIFIPIQNKQQEIFEFYSCLSKWFLHFEDGISIEDDILLEKTKKNRNILNKESKVPVVYRRGVMVRELQNFNRTEGLFDYNLNNLKVDESRNCDDWSVLSSIGAAIANCDNENIHYKFFKAFEDGKEFYEKKLSEYHFSKNKKWKESFESYYDEQTVVVSTIEKAEKVRKKGWKPVLLPENWVSFLVKCGVNDYTHILSSDDLLGRKKIEATEAVNECLTKVWNFLSSLSLTKGLEKPKVFCFTQEMQGESICNGYYNTLSKEICINTRISDVISKQLFHTVIEECTHYITESTDMSRDFQNFLLDIIVEVI